MTLVVVDVDDDDDDDDADELTDDKHIALDRCHHAKIGDRIGLEFLSDRNEKEFSLF